MEKFDLDLLEDFKEILPNPSEVPEEDEPIEPEKEVETEPKEEELVEAKSEPKEPKTPKVIEDDSPLTERERVLLERLEAVTGQTLEVNRPVPGLELKEVPKDEHDFIGEEDIDEVLSSKENLNRLLQSVYQRGLSEASKLSAESVMQSLPKVVTQYISQHLEMRETVNKFYADNPDLTSVKRTVAAVANEIASANPELSTDEVFKRTAQQTRTMLRLRSPQTNTTGRKNPVSNNTRPAFAGQKGRMQVAQLDGLAKEIQELMEI